jgi:hypothetical protein
MFLRHINFIVLVAQLHACIKLVPQGRAANIPDLPIDECFVNHFDLLAGYISHFDAHAGEFNLHIII